jgi:hypothetical protein
VKSYTTSRDTTADGLFSAKPIAPFLPQIQKSTNLMPIVAESGRFGIVEIALRNQERKFLPDW